MSRMKVSSAIKIAWDELPEQFFSLSFCHQVRTIMRSYTMDGTILRTLRRLRSNGVIDYEIIDSKKGLYKKK